MTNLNKEELKTLDSIFFDNGVKCDSEQFLIEDLMSWKYGCYYQSLQELKEKIEEQLE